MLPAVKLLLAAVGLSYWPLAMLSAAEVATFLLLLVREIWVRAETWPSLLDPWAPVLVVMCLCLAAAEWAALVAQSLCPPPTLVPRGSAGRCPFGREWVLQGHLGMWLLPLALRHLAPAEQFPFQLVLGTLPWADTCPCLLVPPLLLVPAEEG